MKKLIYLISGVTAISLFIGCGNGSSNSSTSSSNEPAFIGGSASVNSSQDAAQAASIIHMLADNIDIEKPVNKKIINLTSINNPFLKNKKIGLLNTTLNNISIMDVNNSTCETNTTEDNLSDQCINGGTFVRIRKKFPDGNECVLMETFRASNCMFNNQETIDENNSYDDNFTENGYLTLEKRGVLDYDAERNTTIVHPVGISIQENFSLSFVETGKEDGIKYSTNGSGVFNVVKNINYKYHIDENNSFVNDNILTFTLKGLVDYSGVKKYENNKTLNGYLKFNSDFTLIKDDTLEDENITNININGWINEKFNFFDDVERNFSVGFKNFKLYIKELPDNVIEENLTGMVGNECLGGMVDINTLQILEDNRSDIYDLPNSGLLKILGANNSYAYIRFFQDDKGTHAEVNTSNGESKEYNTTEQMEEGACKPYYIEPIFDMGNGRE